MNLEMFSLKGKVALVTGSSRGLGFVMSRGLAEAGARVILNGRNEERLKKAVDELKRRNLDVAGYSFDVAKSNEVKDNIERIENEIGPIEILFNNAGIQIRSPFEEFDEDNWRELMNVNLTGPFLVSKYVAKSMIKRESGKIINICSMQSELGRATITPYACSKGGLKMMTKGMATEWGKYNIQVNGIGPGYFITEMTKPLADNEKFNSWLCSRTPANRWGKPEELIGAAVFLSSDASSYVNGQILYVDGGMLACV